MKLQTILLFALIALQNVHAAEPMQTRQLPPNAQSPAATVADVAWLQGHWKGNALGGQAEEMWTPPQDGVMLGMFRLIRDRKPSFYELLTMAEDQGTLVLNLKHFEPNLTSWEEKAESQRFRLVAKEPDRLLFEGMTFVRTSADAMTVYVATGEPGKMTELRFDYRRVASAP